jgi:acetate kinase
LGLTLDAEANLVRSGSPRVVSAPDSAFPVLVVPTDEERAIAEATAAVVSSVHG